MARHRFTSRLALLLIGLLLLAACGDDGEERVIERARDLKEPRTYPPGIPDTMERLGLKRWDPGGAAHPKPPAPAAPYTWTLPEGWTDLPPRQFREGNWRVNNEPDVQAYLSVLPGTGGGVLANVNRWRSQMGLDPATEESLRDAPRLDVLGEKALFLELDGTFTGMGGRTRSEGYRMVGVLVAQHMGRCVTVKLVGPKAKVEKAKPALIDLCRSLKPGKAGSKPAMTDPHAGHGHTAPGHGQSASGLKYVVPKGWRTAKPRQFREINLLPTDGPETECFVTVLGGTGGGLEMNVNRWRGQMGQAELSAAEIAALPTIKVLNRDSKLVEITGSYGGMGGQKRTGYMMLVAVCVLQKNLITVKMTGPEKTVREKKSQFIAFCKSLHL